MSIPKIVLQKANKQWIATIDQPNNNPKLSTSGDTPIDALADLANNLLELVFGVSEALKLAYPIE